MAIPKKSISILLAAGASTRMKSKKSKLLHEVLGRPILDWALDQSNFFGHSSVLVVGHQREEIEKRAREVSSKKIELQFAHQKEPKGTADAVRAALNILEKESEDSPIFIMGADSVLLKKETLQKFLKDFEAKKSILSLMTTRISSPNAYGRILRNSQGGIEKIVEVKEANAEELAIDEVNAGFYLIGLKALREALSQVTNRNSAKEFYLTDLVSLARSKGWLVTTQEISPNEALGVNTRGDLALVDYILKTRQNLMWMEKGVTLTDPESIRIDHAVELSEDVTLEPGVQLKGKTKIASGCSIGSHSILEDTILGANVRIEAFSHIKGAELGAKVSAGPFARIRPGSVLEEEVHIGNFVEVKKSHLAKGVKAGHLSYLGDATIGKDSNIGAGTITCNFDGFSKFETKIGKNVFIGSNSSLIAPLKLGDGVIVGAGSVVTKDVLKDSIVLERSEQQEKKGGAKIFRENRQKKD
ncbi:MAG: UDP-N-acetylglucosamine pyrophosphorylase [Bacteriovoracaceae bacterium]|nr:UDP-N-acetylglucosamine pyrophosphorylase [Bacteriovoracaceae bacterium]